MIYTLRYKVGNHPVEVAHFEAEDAVQAELAARKWCANKIGESPTTPGHRLVRVTPFIEFRAEEVLEGKVVLEVKAEEKPAEPPLEKPNFLKSVRAHLG